MTIITRQRSDKFAIIPNAVAEDNRLSFAARGLLVYLLAKPNNWQVKISDIRSSGGIGRDLAYKLLDELKVAGYIEIEKKRTAPGTFASHNYVVYDNAIPGNLPLPENAEVAAPRTEYPEVVNPVPCLPDTDEPYPVNTDAIINTKKITNTHSSPLPPERLAGSRFVDLWDAWPARERPDNRRLAETLFGKLRDHDQVSAIKHADAYRNMHVLRSSPYRMIPYLKQKGFREFEGAPPLNRHGNFEITPERPEWRTWINDIRDRNGDRVAEIASESKVLSVKTRWPVGYTPLPEQLSTHV